MFNVTKFPAISVLTGMLLSVSGAFASAPLFIPLGTMIAEAEAVAVVRIEKIDEILRPRDMPKVWYPNRTVTIRTTEIVRGKLPESFTVRVLIDTHSNPSAKVGEAALIFLSDTKPGKDGDLPAYEAAQGFRVVSDLVSKGDEKAQTAAGTHSSQP